MSPGSDCRRLPLRLFLDKIEKQKGKARRVWIMDRGIPTEEILGEMRQCETPVYYLVGTPKGRLNKLEKELLPLQWAEVHENLAVKLLKQDGELYVLASSRNRQAKERSMRRRQLKRYWNRLKEIRNQNLDLYHLLMKSGAAKKEAGRAAGLVDVTLPLIGQPVTPETFNFQLRRDKLRHVRRQEGQYLLRSNLCAEDPAVLWKYYMVLVEMEEAFKTLKMDLSVRPVFHQKD